MDNYIGLDAHSKTCTFAVIDGRGTISKVHQIDTHETKIVSFLKGIKGRKVLTFEESFLSKWLYTVLKPHVEKLVVCNPCYIAKRGKAKTDRIDAINLAQELRSGNLVEVFHVENDELFDLRRAVKAYRKVVSQAIQTKNRIRMLFRSQGIGMTGTEVFRNREVFKKLPSSVDQMVGENLFEQLAVLQSSRKEYRHYFEQTARKNKTVFALTTIPGIEAFRACVIASTVCDPDRFISKHHFWSYSSLVKHKQISDGKVYGYKRAFGRSELKECFYGAAAAVLIYHKTSSLYRFYEEKLKNGCDRFSGRNALARKIASIALAVMRSKQVYHTEEETPTQAVRKRSKVIRSS